MTPGRQLLSEGHAGRCEVALFCPPVCEIHVLNWKARLEKSFSPQYFISPSCFQHCPDSLMVSCSSHGNIAYT